MAPSDLITLENLKQKLPLWRPNDESHLHAIVDMGSNGIRFSVVSLAPPRTRLLSPLFSSRAPISLFDALEGTDPDNLSFPPGTIQLVATAVSRFCRIAARHDVPKSNIVLLATEAMRRASNAGSMMDAISLATDGLRVQILEPAAETLLGAVMGSRSGLVNVHGGALFLDLGGGSVQMTWVDTAVAGYEFAAAKAGNSLPYGAAKLHRILVREPGEVQSTELAKLGNGMRESYMRLCTRFPALGAIRAAYESGDQSAVVNVYMCGGGFRGYGSMLMHDDAVKPFPITSINSYTVAGDRFKETTRLRTVNAEYAEKIPGMSTRRRTQFPAIASVVEAFVQAVPNIGQVTFCGGSNREGFLMMKLPPQIRESNPLHALAPITDEKLPVYNAVLEILSSALPKDLDFSSIPTIFSTGLGPLWVGELWGRQGHDTDTNASFALHHSLIRESDCPGFSHVVRAILAITSVARWGNTQGQVDADILKRLRHIANSRSVDAAFWAAYIGVISGILVTILPTPPRNANELQSTIRFESNRSKETNVIEIAIAVPPEIAQELKMEELIERFKLLSRKPYHSKNSWKILPRQSKW
ncbi:Retrograde regulation protein [Paramyrothecium foliicola]|nr:Retrograde regulation protein [Paramyrothecium foliicola]